MTVAATTLSKRPSVRTPIPGPESGRLLARQETRESNARTYPRRLPIGIARASGSYVEDVDGNIFVDFLTGAGTSPSGTTTPRSSTQSSSSCASSPTGSTSRPS